MSTARREAGFTLIELLATMVVLSLVMGATVAFVRSQNVAFVRGADRAELSQSLRFAASTVDRVLRTTGAGVTDKQPMLVYGGTDVVVVNTNYTTDAPDGSAVNVNSDAPAGAIVAWPDSLKSALPNTTFVYPDSTYRIPVTGTPSRAETIAFYLRPDSTTPRTDDYVLLERVNAMLPEVVARHILPYTGRPFFQYFIERQTNGTDSLLLAGAGAVPIVHAAAVHGGAADIGASALADSVRAIRFSYTVTTGKSGAEERRQPISTVIGLPNNGLIKLATCGDTPIVAGPLTLTTNVAGDPPSVTLHWPASVDESAGEKDVVQYNVYRRLASATAWGPAMLTVSSGQPTYTVTDAAVAAGTAYVYAVSGQDCTPTESPLLLSGTVTPP